MRLRKYLWPAVAIILCMGMGSLGAAAELMAEYKRALVEYYGSVHFHPLLLPMGHRVGDVIDIRTLAVLKGQNVCFPGLKTEVPQENVSQPRVQLLDKRAASFWLKLKYLLGAELKTDDTRRILLTCPTIPNPSG